MIKRLLLLLVLLPSLVWGQAVYGPYGIFGGPVPSSQLPLASGVANNTSAFTTDQGLMVVQNGVWVSAPTAYGFLMGAVIGVNVVATSNITLSNTQTIDGVALSVGQTVLVENQTTASQNGIYIVASGAWSRAVSLPSGYIIAQNCVFLVYVTNGTANIDTVWQLSTSSTSQTIGTSALTFNQIGPTHATSTRYGSVEINVNSGVPTNAGTATSQDCLMWNSTSFNIATATDVNGLSGPCATENHTSGHLQIQNGGVPPTAGAGTLNTNSTDHWGIITGLSSATSVTITFATTFTNTPACTANTSQASTPVYISAISATAVTFNFASLTGSLYYSCWGTQ